MSLQMCVFSAKYKKPTIVTYDGCANAIVMAHDGSKGAAAMRLLQPPPGIFFLFLKFFHLNFTKIYGPQKICKTIHLAPLGTAVGGTQYCSTSYRRGLQRKTLNYRVVDLVESYNFSYKIYLHPSLNKKLQISEKRMDPYHRAPQRRAFLPLWGTAVGPCHRPPRCQDPYHSAPWRRAFLPP
jgi:hypothetical protein